PLLGKTVASPGRFCVAPLEQSLRGGRHASCSATASPCFSAGALWQRKEEQTMAPSGFGHGPGRRAVSLWQRAWLDAYPCDVPSSLPYPYVPVSALLETSAQRFPERPACSLFGRMVRYRDLADRSRRFACS